MTNPHTGDRFTFVQTSQDTNGERLILQAHIESKGPLVPRHWHLLQDEYFEVVSGVLTVETEGESREIGAGQSILLPRGKPHNHYNAGDTAVVYLQTVSPALDFEYLIENLVGLAADGKGKDGKFGLVQELVTLRYLDSKSFLADVPLWLQKALMHTVAPIGRRFGYRAVYPKYSGFEK